MMSARGQTLVRAKVRHRVLNQFQYFSLRQAFEARRERSKARHAYQQEVWPRAARTTGRYASG
jgi:hypothetical protein